MSKAYYLHVRPEIIEDTNEIAIKIGGQKLAQLPRFVLGFGNDLRVRGVPLFEEFVYFSLALEIEPEKDRACVAVGASERVIGNKQSAIPPGDAGNGALLVAPIEGEAQRVDIVGSGFVDAGRGDLWDSSRKHHAANRSTRTRPGPRNMRGEFKLTVSAIGRDYGNYVMALHDPPEESLKYARNPFSVLDSP